MYVQKLTFPRKIIPTLPSFFHPKNLDLTSAYPQKVIYFPSQTKNKRFWTSFDKLKLWLMEPNSEKMVSFIHRSVSVCMCVCVCVCVWRCGCGCGCLCIFFLTLLLIPFLRVRTWDLCSECEIYQPDFTDWMFRPTIWPHRG